MRVLSIVGLLLVALTVGGCGGPGSCDTDPFDVDEALTQGEYDLMADDLNLTAPTCEDTCGWFVYKASSQVVEDLTMCDQTVPSVGGDGNAVSGTIVCSGTSRPLCD